MGACGVIKGLSELALFLSLFLILAAPAFAAGPTITLTTPSGTMVDNDYYIDVYTSDGASPLPDQVVSLVVTSPDGTATISSPLQTDSITGHATALLHTSKKAGYDNITATSGSATAGASILPGPGPAHSLNLTLSYPFALADGSGTVKAMPLVVDAYGNPTGNVPVSFTIDGVPSGTQTTDSSGIASLDIGPFYSPHIVNVTADAPGIDPSVSGRSATATFLLRNNLFLLPYPSTSVPINTNVYVVAKWYYDLNNNIPAVGVPLRLTAFDRNGLPIGDYTGVTDAGGMVRLDFQASSLPGVNRINANNSIMSPGILETGEINGISKDVSSIVLSSSPASPVYADGNTSYTLDILALDKDGNPVEYKDLTVVKNGDVNDSLVVITKNNGRQRVNIGPSRYVKDVNLTVCALTANNTTVTSSITVRYVAGPAATLKVYANPYVVASAEVLTPPGMPDVHRTDITAVVTDQWGHPIPGRSVTISSPNLTQGSITGSATGSTSGSGEFTTQFTLGSAMHGEDLAGGIVVKAESGALSDTCKVYYTDNSFLSIKSTIDPNTNVSVGDTINVSLTVRGIGWKIRPQNSSVSLIFDTSGSMDWLSTIIYPETRLPKTGTMEPWHYTNWSSTTGIDNRDWHYIDTYNYTGSGSDIQFMLSSNYRNYGWYGSFYYLKVTDPNGVNRSTDYTYTTDVQNSQNENFIRFPNAGPGTYTIYGSYAYDPAKGDVPYNMMVLTTPKRLGQVSDHDSAAKVAARSFVANMTNSQIDVIWFNVSSDIARHFTVDDSINRSVIEASIDGLSASGGTSIYLGLDKAISDFNSGYYRAGNRKVIVLLSDGYSQTPANDQASALTAAGQNITIYTIGMGMPDDANLDAIARVTPDGNYTRVYTDSQLNEAYWTIWRSLQEVVANYTEMHLLSSCTYVNSSWEPDVEYVDGSGFVSYPNGTSRWEDPDPLPFVDANGTYNIVWTPGVIKLNDTWSVNYSLKVRKDGNITPIRNDSYVYFIRDDGSSETMHFGSETLYVSGSPDDMTPIGPNVTVIILDPPSQTGVKAKWPEQTINWKVIYLGSGEYHQLIYLTNKNSPISEGYNGTMNNTFTYDLPTKNMADGNYILWVYASDGDEANFDWVALNITKSNGWIMLE